MPSDLGNPYIHSATALCDMCRCHVYVACIAITHVYIPCSELLSLEKIFVNFVNKSPFANFYFCEIQKAGAYGIDEGGEFANYNSQRYFHEIYPLYRVA